MYLITAYFDEKTNKELQRMIDRIADKTGNTFMTAGKVPPHMTICQIEAKNENVLVPAFESLRGKVKEGDIFIASAGQLLPYVMLAAPVMNEYLLDLSRKVYDAVEDIPEAMVSKFYKPYSWMPHITLGKTLDKEQMQAAFKVMQDSFVPMNARVTALGLSRVNPHTDVQKIALDNN